VPSNDQRIVEVPTYVDVDKVVEVEKVVEVIEYVDKEVYMSYFLHGLQNYRYIIYLFYIYRSKMLVSLSLSLSVVQHTIYLCI
jgi:hypothetical protein